MKKALSSIAKLNDTITVIEELPEVAAEHFGVAEKDVHLIHNELVVQRSIEDFRFFFNHKL